MPQDSTRPKRTRWQTSKGVFVSLVFVAFLGLLLILLPTVFSRKTPNTGLGSDTASSTASPNTQGVDTGIARAESLLNSGETTAALAVLAELKAGSSDPRIDVLIKSVVNKTPSTPSQPATTPAPPRSGYTTEVANIASLMPKAITEFVPGIAAVERRAIVLPFSPTMESVYSAQVQRATFEVHDRRTVLGARQFLTNTIKRAYPTNRKVVRVGAGDAYFGTDSTREAAVAFTRGRYAFVVVVSAEVGVVPKSLESIAVKLSSSFPASR